MSGYTTQMQISRNETGRIDRETYKAAGPYDFPVLRKCNKIPKQMIPFNMAMSEKDRKDKWVHFYIDDYQFERIWHYPSRYIEILKGFAGVIAPDFSMLSTMPRALQIYNCWRNRVIARMMQEAGIEVIPSLDWIDGESLNWCLAGLPIGGTYAVETYGCVREVRKRSGFLKGLEKVIQELRPHRLVVYGQGQEFFGKYLSNAFWFDTYCQSLRNRVK